MEVGASRGALYIELGDTTAAYRAYYYVRRAGERVVLYNDGFHVFVRELRGRGFGLRVFHRQARNAARLGIGRIETVAGRRCGENGYYTWPRFGFDAALPPVIRRRLPPELKNIRTLLGLMKSENGRRWWRVNGATIRAYFDLTAGSRSWQTLNGYLKTQSLRK